MSTLDSFLALILQVDKLSKITIVFKIDRFAALGKQVQPGSLS